MQRGREGLNPNPIQKGCPSARSHLPPHPPHPARASGRQGTDFPVHTAHNGLAQRRAAGIVPPGARASYLRARINPCHPRLCRRALRGGHKGASKPCRVRKVGGGVGGSHGDRSGGARWVTGGGSAACSRAGRRGAGPGQGWRQRQEGKGAWRREWGRGGPPP